MSVILFFVFWAALVGVFRPYINGLKRAHFGVAAAVSFVLFGATAPDNANNGAQSAASSESRNSATAITPSPEAAPTAASSPAAPEPTPSKWQYSEDKDEMRGTTTKYATVESGRFK